ncbi:MAG: hypothetical protein KAW47_04220 [Thermoplasmatales archaeon]|nr:hypothetical protein [Thermoplasmatales archaeon]
MLFNDINWLVIIILVGGYLFTFLSSTFLVRTIIKTVSKREGEKKKHSLIGTGLVVGICENFIILTLVLLNEVIGLTIIFTAKTIVRSKEISKEPQYYLVGTMLNFSYSLFMAVIIKTLIMSA